MTRAAAPIQPGTHRGQQLDHVAHHIIGGLTGIDDHHAAALGGQRGIQLLHPETSQPIPMLHTNHRGRRVRQHPGQLRTLAIEPPTNLADHVDYYTRLERGNLTGVSENVLHAVARALQLDDAERQHLFDLARAANAAPRTRRRSSSVGVRPSVQRVLDAMSGAPAWVHNDRLDFLAANRLGYALYSEFFTDPVRPANSARFMFLNSRSRDFYPDWEQIADNTVAILRGAAGRDPFDEKLTKLVGELSTRSEEFRSRWAAHNVRLHRTGVKYLHHPVVGDVELTYEGMELPADPGLMLFVYTAEPGTPSEDGLKLLASWAATQELAESAPAGSQARLRRSDG